ncbi:MAG TPA: Ig-like domain-containing protein, partial [Gammaproteobacteria bacterium]|nr:Ig-like domain-containing protein [Gammaproteobacteria bacterium]
MLWVSGTQSVFMVSPVNGTPELELAGLPLVQALAVNQQNNHLWVYSHRHLWAFDSLGNQHVNEWLSREIQGDDPVGMVVDARAGNLWIGVQTRLYRLDLNGKIKATLDLHRQIESLSLDTTRSQLWIAERRQLAVLDEVGTTLFTVPLERDPQALAYDAGLDQVWVVSGHTVSRFDAGGNQVFTQVFTSREAGDINDHIAPDGQGGLWAAGDATLSYIDASGNLAFTLTPFASDPDHDGDMGHRGRIADLVADPLNHTVWVAGARHLEQYATDSTLKQTIDVRSFTGNNPDCPSGSQPAELSSGDHSDRCDRERWGGWQGFWFGDNGVRHVALYVDTLPPTIAITAPGDLTYTNRNKPTFAVAWADAGSGVDSTTLKVTSDGAPLPVNCLAGDSGAECSVASALQDGTYTLSTTVADYAGNKSKLASLTFTIDTVPPPLPGGAFIGFTPGPAGSITLIGQAGGMAADVASVSITDIRTGQTVTGTVNGDGSYSVSVPGTTSDEFAVTFTDLAGNVSAPFYMHGSDVPLQLAITAPAVGANIPGDVLNVFGTVQAPANTGITVNGVPAVLSGGQWVANNLSLAPSASTLTVTATTSGGLTATRTLNVSRAGSSSLILNATPAAVGVVPLEVTFEYQFLSQTAPQSLRIDYSGSGNFVDVSDPAATLSYTYSTPGIYVVTLILTDANYVQYQAQLGVVVQDAEQLDALFQGIWGDMTTALVNGNKPAAM